MSLRLEEGIVVVTERHLQVNPPNLSLDRPIYHDIGKVHTKQDALGKLQADLYVGGLLNSIAKTLKQSLAANKIE